jgi:hypothetical protein
MSDFIYTNTTKLNSNTEQDKFYGIISNYDFVDQDNNPRISKENDERVLAKVKYKINGHAKFLVKLDNAKKLFNPTSPLSENRKNQLLEQYSVDSSNFREVSKKVFDYYITFLRTSNPSWIHNAEREDF